eukprot:6713365-Pyramimonas_sp.AAC.1
MLIIVQEPRFFLRVTLPPTPHRKQLRPDEHDSPGRIRIVGHAKSTIDGGPLLFVQQQRGNTRDGTSDEVRKLVTEANGAGPVPPRIAAVRGRAYHAIKENARMVHDPIFALLGELEVESVDQAFKFLKAEFDSDDRPDSVPQEAYNER